jgi:hypothetical protein
VQLGVDAPSAELLHSYTGTTRWVVEDARIQWDGVWSPPTAFEWVVHPEVGPLGFTTAPFAVPEGGPGDPGLIWWHFQGDATLPGFGTGETVCGRAPDLTVDLAHEGDFASGDPAAPLSIVVSNPSPFASAGTTALVNVQLPPQLGIGPVQMSGNGWSCSPGSRQCSRFDVLAPGAAYPPIDLRVSVPPALTASVTATVELLGGGDVTPANNVDQDLLTFSGYASGYTPSELALLDRVGAFLGVTERSEAQRTGGLFLAYLDGIIVAQGLTPPDFPSDWPWSPNALTGVRTDYTPEQEALVQATATRFSTDVPTLQRRGVLLLDLIIRLSAQ